MGRNKAAIYEQTPNLLSDRCKTMKQSSRKQVRRVRVKVPARIWACDRVLLRSGPVPAVLTTVTLDYSFDNVQILFYDSVFGAQFGVP